MIRKRGWRWLAVIAVLAASVAVWAPSARAAGAGHYSGTTSDGGTWIADVPANWNGTLLLYSHGYGPLVAADAPNPQTQADLLSLGYALAGSSFDPNGSPWALASALPDQFQALTDVEQTVLPSPPKEVIAVGTSMGGLISALEAQHSDGRLSGVLSTCGIVGGGEELANYQVDGEYVLAQLLAPNENIQLVNFQGNEAATVANEVQTIGSQAQTTAQGRARLALAMAFLNVTTWSGSASAPPPANDYTLQEQEQYQTAFSGFLMPFLFEGRAVIEGAAGGNNTWTKGVDFAQQLARSPYRAEVQALYRQAGLSLSQDLNELTRDANITADPQAVRWTAEYTVPSGKLQVPELNLHTVGDNLVPVQMENTYRHVVLRAGSASMLRQAYVERQGHCNFTPPELIAGVEAVQQRISTGHWGTSADPAQLEASATGLGLGPAAFVPYRPGKLTGDNGPFNPFTDGS